jgi:hypothetical protein
MSRRKISQVEAWNLLHKCQRLEADENRRRHAWAKDWPNGTHIGSINGDPDGGIVAAIKTARKLRHAVIVTVQDNGTIAFIAMPLVTQNS